MVHNDNKSLNSNYVLITPAYNEGWIIEKTIKSILSQTILPIMWIIIDDNSIDNTYKIIKNYSNKYNFIVALNLNHEHKREFASKVIAFNYGLEYLKKKNLDYQFIGNLDADITMDADYYENIINKFIEDKTLGIAGGEILVPQGSQFKSRIFSVNSVAGAVQLFRKECFEEIGGYKPLRYGGIDAVAENYAKMYGWKIQTFKDLKVHHHRAVGVSKNSILRGRFIYGIKENHMGTHPFFLILKCVSRFSERPYIIGSFLMLIGYFYSLIRKDKRGVSKEYVQFLRKQQLKRITAIFS